jgi:hypothetical protein
MAAASDETRRDVEVTEVNETGDEIVAHVVGELATVERFRDASQPYVGRRQRLVLDVSAVTFMDTPQGAHADESGGARGRRGAHATQSVAESMRHPDGRQAPRASRRAQRARRR